jgi:hypothetical protein
MAYCAYIAEPVAACICLDKQEGVQSGLEMHTEAMNSLAEVAGTFTEPM